LTLVGGEARRTFPSSARGNGRTDQVDAGAQLAKVSRFLRRLQAGFLEEEWSDEGWVTDGGG